MASNSKCSLSPSQRKQLLISCGFVEAEHAAGSHVKWVHPKLEELAKTHPIDAPVLLLSTPHQKPWQITLPDNPGGRTWSNISRLATWCKDMVSELTASSDMERNGCVTKREFNKASGDWRAWQKEVKHHIKAGLSDFPPAPFRGEILRDMKNDLSRPAK